MLIRWCCMTLAIQQVTNFVEPTGISGQAPYNQFSHGKAFPPADWKHIVGANVDTLYSLRVSILARSPSCSWCRRPIVISCCRC
jgi:hypothetical protein